MDRGTFEAQLVSGSAVLTVPSGIDFNGLYLATFPSYSGRIYLFSVRSEGVDTVFKSSGLEGLTVTKDSSNKKLTFSFSGVNNQSFEVKKV